MRILYVNQSGTTIGGIEAHIRDAATGLAQRGHQLGLVVGEKTIEPLLAQPFSDVFFYNSLTQAALSNSTARFQPDVVMVHKAERLFELGLETLAAPVVVMVHDHDWICIRRHRYLPITSAVCERRASLMACAACGLAVGVDRTRRLKVRYRPVWHRLRDAQLLGAVQGVWVASVYMLAELVRHGVPQEQVTVLPLGVPVIDETPRAVTPGLVVFVGQLIRTKGLDVLLHAMVDQPSIERCVIVGSGAQRQEFETLAKQLGVDNRVQWLGKQSPEQVADVLKQAAVVVVPSRWPEPFGLVGLEAMRAGRPVVATDVGGVRAWLDPGVTGLLTRPADPVDLGRALRTILTNDLLQTRMGQAAKQRYQAFFTMDRFLDRLETALVQATLKFR